MESINGELAEVRYDWTNGEIKSIYNLPLLELIYAAATVHRQYHNPSEIQVCSLLSIKTGGCTEDCAYCSQSVHYNTGVEVQSLLSFDEVLRKAESAKYAGATRFCMGAAWREVRDNKDFDRVLEMVRAVNDLGLEVCATLGMITEAQALKLKEAGLYAYNHNIDTSDAHYKKIITTRTYQDRLDTIKNTRKAAITVCCGGIIGMGESMDDRIAMLMTLANLNPHPESVPINALVPIEGTPLEGQERVNAWEFARMIATARIVMPRSIVRLSAGRLQLSQEAQALCFLAGANSIFAGDKLLTTSNPALDEDAKLLSVLGVRPRKPFESING
ncbi:MAG TPA: biotin synthase BioB [Candidatus Acidoferrales bacterium]|nr:biotin synthase BioB [Candidatus Acidoferrales bacterium]